MAKITGKEGLDFKGKARTFDSEDDFVKAVESGSIKKGEKTVVILRYLGPQGGPGMCSVLPMLSQFRQTHPFLSFPWTFHYTIHVFCFAHFYQFNSYSLFESALFVVMLRDALFPAWIV